MIAGGSSSDEVGILGYVVGLPGNLGSLPFHPF